MAEISGVEGSILAGGVALEASECSIDLDQAVVDRSHWGTAGEPLNAAGQRTGNLSASGPVSTTSNLVLKGVTRGTLITFRKRVNSLGTIFVQIQGRVSKVSLTNNKDDGPKWSIQASQYGPATLTGI